MTKDVSKDKQGDIVTVNEIPKGNRTQKFLGLHATEYSDPNGIVTDNRSFFGENPTADCKSGKKPDVGAVIKAAELLKTTGAYFSDADKERANPSMHAPLRHNIIFAKGSPIKELCK